MNQQRQLLVGRLVILIGIVEFAVSVTLLVIASVSRDRLPLWVGVIDVILALTLVVTIAVIRGKAVSIAPRTMIISYQVATSLPVVLFLALWMFRAQFDFNYLTGVAWRTWLLLYGLPASLTVWKQANS